LPTVLPAAIFITVQPDSLAAEALSRVHAVLGFGDTAPEVVAAFARTLNIPGPRGVVAPASDEILFWSPGSGQTPRLVKIDEPRQVHRRHMGKYAAGDVGEWHSFYFRGPGDEINRRAQNLLQFLQIAEEVGDAVWEHHLRANDYSAWFRHVIRDEELAREVAEIENDRGLDPRKSRRRIGKAVSRRYVAPVTVG
jgi:hypothetical protein